MAELVSAAVSTQEVGEEMETLFLSCEAPVRALENAKPEKGVVGSCSSSAEDDRKARGLELLQLQKQCASEEEYQTARTRPIRTEVDCRSSGSEDGASFVDFEECLRQNRLYFQRLVDTRPRNSSIIGPVGRAMFLDVDEFDVLVFDSPFFFDFRGRVDARCKIAEGGQAGIYEVLFDGQVNTDFVLKVFEKSCEPSLAGLQRTWVSEIGNHFMKLKGLDGFMRKGRHCSITNGTLLKDDRFAFVMERCWGDLRKAIDNEVIKNSSHKKPPFPLPMSILLMLQIALGMKELHAYGILHRDLKSANVLLDLDPQKITKYSQYKVLSKDNCLISDYECCNGVLGTGFWRAPEVLDALKNRVEDIWTNPKIWTKKADVYSYAMTCYEILSGCIPFHNRKVNDYDGVIGGDRPSLPDYVDGEIQELLRRCWHHEPEMRPSFEEIEAELRGYIIKKKKFYNGLGEDERDVEDQYWLILFNEEDEDMSMKVIKCSGTNLSDITQRILAFNDLVEFEKMLKMCVKGLLHNHDEFLSMTSRPILAFMIATSKVNIARQVMCNLAHTSNVTRGVVQNSSFENYRGHGRGIIRGPKNPHPLSQRGSNPSVPCDLGLNLPGLFRRDNKYGAEGKSSAI